MRVASASAAPRLSLVGHAEHLRRGRCGPTNNSADHEDSLRVVRRDRACISFILQPRPRLELHRLEIQHLSSFFTNQFVDNGRTSVVANDGLSPD